MRFVKTVNLWDAAIDTALRAGTLKLQTGQWVQCGEGKKSRWLGCLGHTLNVAHYPNTSGQNFLERAYYHKAALGGC